MTVEVTQEDREAASNYIGGRCGDSIPDASLAFDRIPNGKADSHTLVQAFARHRIEATRAAAERIAELEGEAVALRTGWWNDMRKRGMTQENAIAAIKTALQRKEPQG